MARHRPARPRTVAAAAGTVVLAVFAAGTIGSHLADDGKRPAPAGAASPTAPVPPSGPAMKAPVPAVAVPPMAAPTRPGPPTTAAPGARPLTGKVVVLDPGHNGGNAAALTIIDRPVWNGRSTEACDTVGTQTATGYPESRFNLAVATMARTDLEAAGARVVLTRADDTGVGPCITDRAAIGNRAHAAAVVSIHADGGPSWSRGFAILRPVADGTNDAVIGSSTTLGIDLRDAFGPATGMPISDDDGIYGLQSRDDLAGLNLTTVPKVFVECGNMRNATDASLLADPAWQAQAARGIAAGISVFLTGRPG